MHNILYCRYDNFVPEAVEMIDVGAVSGDGIDGQRYRGKEEVQRYYGVDVSLWVLALIIS